jgi:O-antigen/teichoic acid export membrane protein
MNPPRPAVRSGVGRAMAGRLSWGLADQAISSLTNFAVGIFVARSLGVTAFGIFSLAWVTYSVVLNLSRGLATDPLMVRFSGVLTDSWYEAVARCSGTALSVGVLTGAVSLLAGIGMGGSLGAAFVVLGLILPLLIVQDSWRYAWFAIGQGGKAFANDIVWAAALVPAMILAAHRPSVVGFLLAWGLSGAVAASYGCVQLGIVPRATGVRRWLRQQRDLGPRYMVENLSYSGAVQLRMYGLGAIAGLADVGAVRGADLLLAPYVAVLMGLSLATVAEAARVLRRGPRRLWTFCLLLGAGQAASVLVWGLGLLFLLPDSAGRFILGSVWESASTLILPTTLALMGISLYNAALAGLRALGAARRSMRSQLIVSAVYVSCGLVGAVVAGALGSTWGAAVATLFGAVLWWAQLNAGLREHTATPAAPDVP